MVDTEKLTITDCFQSYCRPVINPKLSEFCKELTGITQEQVDQADTFPLVLERFETWLKNHKLGTKNKFAMATDGPWDMGRFLFGQCKVLLFIYFLKIYTESVILKKKRFYNFIRIYINLYSEDAFTLFYLKNI